MANDEAGVMIDVETPDGPADCYLTLPDGDGPHPAVLFVPDVFGLRPRIFEMADRIAAAGYVVLAPNFFYRSGRSADQPAVDLSNEESRSAFFASLGDKRAAAFAPEAVQSSGQAYLDYLQGVAGVASGPVGVTGYCAGGVLGWLFAADFGDRIAALGGWHAGNLVTDAADSPHLRAPDVKAEVFFGFADQDHSMTPDQIASLDLAMTDAGLTFTTEVFEGAAHGYSMSDAAVYDEAAAERHFTELFALLDRTLR